MDLTTNGFVITDAIKFVQTNKAKLLSTKEDKNGEESKEPDYDEDKEQLGIGTRRGDTGTRNNKPRFLISG